MSNTLLIARLTFHSRSSTVFLVALRVEICFAFNVNEIWLMYITLYIISPICYVKELIMDKPHKDCEKWVVSY